MKIYQFLAATACVFLLGCFAFAVRAQDEGARISFKRGSTSATVKGTVAKGGPDFYLVGAKAGQTMTVRSIGKVSFGLDSPDGNLTDDDGNTNWAGELPADGDYRIRVYSNGGAQNYSLTVAIAPAAKGKIAQKFTTSGSYDGISVGTESGDYGGMAVYLTESDAQLYALVTVAEGDFFDPVLVEANLSGREMRGFEFVLPDDSGGRPVKGVVTAAGLKLATGELLKRRCGGTYSNISVGPGGDYGGMEVYLTDAGGRWFALVTAAEGVLLRPVLVEAKVTGKNFDKIEFTLPDESGDRTFKGTITKSGMTLNADGTLLVLKEKCYK